MNSTKALSKLREHKAEMLDRFNLNYLAIFGSVARNEANQTSDIDILVDFKDRANSRSYYGLQFFLEDLLECPVDLVTTKAMRAELRPYIERDLLHV